VNRRILTIALISAAVAAAVGATLAIRASSSNEQPPVALTRARLPSDALPTPAVNGAAQRGLSADQSRMVAPNTYLVPTSDSRELCLVSILNSEMRATCNPQGRFFAGRQFVFTIAEEGSPNALSGLTIAGIARPAVATIRATFPDGTLQEATPTADGGFLLNADSAGLTAGEPTSIAALDNNGHLLETDPGPGR
jgi:hypothetical protein